MDSAERTVAVQLEYAKGAISQATLNARALSQVKDVQELVMSQKFPSSKYPCHSPGSG